MVIFEMVIFEMVILFLQKLKDLKTNLTNSASVAFFKVLLILYMMIYAFCAH